MTELDDDLETMQMRRERIKSRMEVGYLAYQKNRHARVEQEMLKRDQTEYLPYGSYKEFESDLALADRLGFSIPMHPNYQQIYSDMTPYREALAEMNTEAASALHPFPNFEALNATVAAAIRAHSQFDTNRIRNLSDLYLFSATLRKNHGVAFGAASPEETLTPEATFIAALLGADVTQDFAPFADALHLEQAVEVVYQHSIPIRLDVVSSFQAFYKLFSAIQCVQPLDVSDPSNWSTAIAQLGEKRNKLSDQVYALVEGA